MPFFQSALLIGLSLPIVACGGCQQSNPEYWFMWTSSSQVKGGPCEIFRITTGPSVQFISVTQLCLTLWDPMDCSMPIFPVHQQFLELAQTHIYWVSDAIQPSHPLSSPSLPASIFPNIRVFSSESVLHIKCPKYWSFSFNISLSNEYLGLISFMID